MFCTRTESRLLDVAVDQFGRCGIAGTSTRAIAREAQTPMSSITYYFGGKEGLYCAAAERVAEQLTLHIQPILNESDQVFGEDGDAAAARLAIQLILKRIAEIMVDPDTTTVARFIVREQIAPESSFTRLGKGPFGPVIERLSTLVRRLAGGRMSKDEAHIRGIALCTHVLISKLVHDQTMAEAGNRQAAAGKAATAHYVIEDHLNAICDRLERVNAD
jgi:AcrR family transcriptional regulator